MPQSFPTSDPICLNHFRRLFIAKTGLSPKRYIDRLKVRKASEDLVAGDDSIAEIAEKYGYEDPFHFSRRFKEILGLSPHHYRERELQR